MSDGRDMPSENRSEEQMRTSEAAGRGPPGGGGGARSNLGEATSRSSMRFQHGARSMAPGARASWKITFALPTPCIIFSYAATYV